tara:strand:+ start:566 stop:1603 length:1038 start_codon:yes stop_codon:yes gene_type:complete
MWYEYIIDRGLIPEPMLRLIVRSYLWKYSNRVNRLSEFQLHEIQKDFLKDLGIGPIAEEMEMANQQHYEISPKFYERFLGSQMKYSGSIWTAETKCLSSADLGTLDLYLDRADLKDGHRVLELGSGWGSLCLHIAKRLPNALITSVTNSESQKSFIDDKIRNIGLDNLVVVHSDVNVYQDSDRYDRILSIEMFEHLRNPTALMKQIVEWMKSDGRLFLQVFSHRVMPQYFDDTENSWMAKNFFTRGVMPYSGMYDALSKELTVIKKWHVSGLHYHRSLEAWLQRLKIVGPTFSDSDCAGDPSQKNILHNKFRFFLIFCSELFKFNRGLDWHVDHYFMGPSRGVDS